MKPIEVTKDNIDQFISAPGIVILDFWASWCGPCKTFAPTFDKLAAKHTDIRFGKINTEQERELAAQFQIRSIPTLMMFRDGVQLMNQAGAASASALEDVFAQAKALDMEKIRAEVAAEMAAGKA